MNTDPATVGIIVGIFVGIIVLAAVVIGVVLIIRRCGHKICGGHRSIKSYMKSIKFASQSNRVHAERLATHMHKYIHKYTHTHMHKYIHKYIHEYTHAYIHKYIHTYRKGVCGDSIEHLAHTRAIVRSLKDKIVDQRRKFRCLEQNWPGAARNVGSIRNIRGACIVTIEHCFGIYIYFYYYYYLQGAGA